MAMDEGGQGKTTFTVTNQDQKMLDCVVGQTYSAKVKLLSDDETGQQYELVAIIPTAAKKNPRDMSDRELNKGIYQAPPEESENGVSYAS